MYGGAQELATSVYDSPIAPQNPQSATSWTSSVYSPEDASAPPAAPDNAAPAPYTAYYGGEQAASAPPPIPTNQPPQEGMAPAPLQPGGPAFDARQGLPSQAPQQPQQQQQYKPYVPPGAAAEPSAPNPNDYYRSGVY